MEVDGLNELIVLAKHGRLAPAARELFMSSSTLGDHVIAHLSALVHKGEPLL